MNIIKAIPNKIKHLLAATGLCVPMLTIGQAPATLKNPYNSAVKINYVGTWESTAPETNPEVLPGRALRAVKQSTVYIDGLGRPIQTVVRQGSLTTGSAPVDLVSAVAYDEFGREQYKYLPFGANTTGGNTAITDGLFKLNPFQQQVSFYNTQLAGQPGETNVGPGNLNWAYGQTSFENSPLNRVLETFAPGSSWVGSSAGSEANRHSVKTKYYLNTTADDVKIINVANVADNWGTYSVAGSFLPGELYKNITIDEQGKQVVEFKDKDGQVLLKKVQFTATDNGTGSGHMGWLCTYYVYDALNNLRLVVQPRGVELLNANSWNFAYDNNVITKEQCFRYEYDARKRMVMKKVPGAGDFYMVYDKWDRLVLTQDANQRLLHNWTYTKYDVLNRPVITGSHHDPGNTSLVLINQQLKEAESWQIRYETIDLTKPNGYTLTQAHPYAAPESVLTVTYYDDYDWVPVKGYQISANRVTTYDGNFVGQSAAWPFPRGVNQSRNVRGLVTGTFVRILGTPYFINTVNIYDEKGRVIQTQSNNISGAGPDIFTTQYSFSGQPLITVQKTAFTNHENIIVTKYDYDDLGRLLTTKKKVDAVVNGVAIAKPEQVISSNEYDALGQLKKKNLAPGKGQGGGPLESLTYDYNVRGWMLGANRKYLLDKNVSGYAASYFGFDLGYDKTLMSAGSPDGIFQYNGNISGVVWKTAGDEVRRKFNFLYDAVNRFGRADYYQNAAPASGGTWGLSDANFSVHGFDEDNAYMMKYDANGNILSMIQHGIAPGRPDFFIDALRYKYKQDNKSNQLMQVSDDLNEPDTKLGDFHYTGTKTGSTVDYEYDNNGNLTSDGNKKISSITYNYLNLPQTIQVTGKGSITYTYDAMGVKLSKAVQETGQTAKRTYYHMGAVYENDTLQFIGHEEGRLRLVKRTFTNASTANDLQYDYFLKDHLGNVRMVLTEQTDTANYMATMESIYRTTEDKLFYNIPKTSYAKSLVPGGYPADGTTNPNDSLARTNGSNNKVGPALVLKVMSGDKVSIGVKSFYKSGGTANSGGNPVAEILSSLASGIVGASGTVKGTFDALSNTGTSPLLGAMNAFRDGNNPEQTTKPKAYLNWILLDEQLKYVAAGSGAKAAGNANILEPLTNDGPVSVPKNGFLYIYVSNETQNWDVFFDNLSVQHFKGPLSEETHYYPFGLTMAGISSKALNSAVPENKKKYNGIEKEDGLGIEIYDAELRELDPQTGRWWQVDPKIESMEMWSPYASNYDNPIRYSDPLGDEGQDCCWDKIKAVGNFVAGAVVGTVVGAVDNVTGANFRGKMSGAFEGTGAAGHGWNLGLNVADAGGVVIGALETVAGGAGMLGGSLVTAGTGGVSTPITVPFILGSATIAAHGVLTIGNSADNLINQNGRVDAGTNSSGSSNAGKRRENRLPDKGTPNSTETNKSGTTTKKYGPDGNVQKEFNKGHVGKGTPKNEKKDHIHDYKPQPQNPTGRGTRMPGRAPKRNELKKDFGL